MVGILQQCDELGFFNRVKRLIAGDDIFCKKSVEYLLRKVTLDVDSGRKVTVDKLNTYTGLLGLILQAFNNIRGRHLNLAQIGFGCIRVDRDIAASQVDFLLGRRLIPADVESTVKAIHDREVVLEVGSQAWWGLSK